MVVHLVDGTYELFRHIYGLRRFNKGKDRPYGAVVGVLQEACRLTANRNAGYLHFGNCGEGRAQGAAGPAARSSARRVGPPLRALRVRVLASDVVAVPNSSTPAYGDAAAPSAR